MKDLSLEKIVYGGEYHRFFWDLDFNPNATIDNALANCTTLVYGDCLLDNFKIVSQIVGASAWHKYSNVPVKKFKPSDVQIGDVIEWASKCHVARVYKIENGKVFIRGSFYTGIHGKAFYNGSYDVRTGFKSLKEVSDFFENNYPYRMYHETDLETENNWVGGEPDYILKCACVSPVSKNEDKNQIYVLVDGQNIRNNPNGDVIGSGVKGYFNVIQKIEDGYVWYEIEKNKWIAQVDGRVVYYPKTQDYSKLYWEQVELNKQLKSQLDDIRKLTEY